MCKCMYVIDGLGTGGWGESVFDIYLKCEKKEVYVIFCTLTF